MTEKRPFPECCKSICRPPDVKVEEELLYEESGPGNIPERYLYLEENVKHQIRRGHLMPKK